MNYFWNMKNIFIKLYLSIKRRKKNPTHSAVWSRLVAVDALVLLHPTPPQRVHVFGPQPGVSAQRGLSQAQRQQPASRGSVSPSQTHLSRATGTFSELRSSRLVSVTRVHQLIQSVAPTSPRWAACGGPLQRCSPGRPSSYLQSLPQPPEGTRNSRALVKTTQDRPHDSPEGTHSRLTFVISSEML